MAAFFDNIWAFLWSYISTIGVSDVFDILIVAYAIYEVLRLVGSSSIGGIVRAIIFLVAALWLSTILKLNLVNYILRQILQIGAIALIVLFQPEIRRFLDNIGNRYRRALGFARVNADEEIIAGIIEACCDMSREKTGALIVVERNTGLREFADTSGTLIEATISVELIKNIFFHNSPLHDGAVIIRSGRIFAASCMLPLSSNTTLQRDLGMRHRAAIGITERTDAVSIVVSEETGSIAVAEDGMLKRHLSRESLEKILKKALLAEQTARKPIDVIRDKFRIPKKGVKK